MIDFASISNRSWVGRVVGMPLRLAPRNVVVPIIQGPLRGTRWIIGSATHGSWLGCYEGAKQAVCVRRIKSGMTAYDLGAHVGFYTLLFSRLVGSHGRVHAFEPSERNLSFLRRHVELNCRTNVTVHATAVGRQSAVATFDPGAGPATGHLSIQTDSRSPGCMVSVASLDDFVYRLGHEPPDLVKMDVEGGEADVLKAMSRLLAEERPALLIAIHGSAQWQRCLGRLREAHYDIESLEGRALVGDVEYDEIVGVPSDRHR